MTLFNELVFAYPEILYVIPLIPIFIFLNSKFRKTSTYSFSDIKILQLTGKTKDIFSLSVNIFRVLCLILLVVAIARPQLKKVQKDKYSNAIDIIMAIDISGSMKAEDFQPENRLEVAKIEARKFIKQRKDDRIGLIVFAKESLTQCPSTLDHDVLLKLLDEVQIGAIEDGTAIGLSIASSINRLRDRETKSKVIILLTDGENNAGQIDPMTAAELAKTFGIRVYTIAVGREGLVPFPHDDPLLGRRYINVEVQIDEKTLQGIAKTTGGKYFRATDQLGLQQAYEAINQLETTKIKVSTYSLFEDVYYWFAIPALLILLLEILITKIIHPKIP